MEHHLNDSHTPEYTYILDDPVGDAFGFSASLIDLKEFTYSRFKDMCYLVAFQKKGFIMTTKGKKEIVRKARYAVSKIIPDLKTCFNPLRFHELVFVCTMAIEVYRLRQTINMNDLMNDE